MENSETFADLFDLDPTFCDSLNASLFDGELPVKLYTHIKIKEDDDDDNELWQSVPGTLSFTFDNSSPSLDYRNEPVELRDELFGPSVNPRDIFKDTEKSYREKEISREILAEVKNSVTCANMSSEIAEDLSIQKETFTHEMEQNMFKRELRARRKRANIDLEHSYFKFADQTGNLKDSDEEYTEYTAGEEIEEESDDDEDYTAPCLVIKSCKTNSNSGKDAKYWERRKKNNLAAKRSREAKRAREIQTAKKTEALEKENASLKKQIRKLQADVKRAEKKLRLMV